MKMTGGRLTGAALGWLVFTGSMVSGWGQATKTSFVGTESHVMWLEQPAPKVTPSGNAIVRGWVHLFYDDADDARLDGYDVVVINAMLDPDGHPIEISGTFAVRKKLDAIPIEDLLSGNFNPGDIMFGATLWEGSYTWTPHEGVVAVAQNSEGLKAFYRFLGGAFSGHVLDPYGR